MAHFAAGFLLLRTTGIGDGNPAIVLPLTLFWLAGVANAYNFMDGLDGLAGAQAIVSGAACA